MNPTIWRSVLRVLLILLGLNGLAGGAMLLADPSGAAMGLSLAMLEYLPLRTFVLPGLFLVVVMGVIPLGIAYATWQHRAWAWRAALTQGIVLVLWIGLQIVLWGTPAGIQVITLVWGLALVAVAYASRTS
ncbi:hypothetical protein [Candidatus Viridilinea mediisalina]|uniref:Uncharacterized protein n=1 Tax=Candidatus Viridilinea mediisalina TaxID=2024553 RepID=A0A2A6RK93_9CHLR|nr:hypothetical protein [Candidatus Viridilinea mediisalina]PDW03341.1 hypothetical protein CJ255_09150 [Candidatus Viridilinea mediisalina]